MPPTPIDPSADDADGESVLDAGPFGPWLEHTLAAFDGRVDADVPCGSCAACCSSGQFVHIEPDEVEALARVPAALRFPAPGLPAGHVVLPHDDRGRCPMLGEHGCTIYEHRPRTCRIYDCRIFTAADVEPDDDQPLIADRVRRWRFDVADGDRSALDAVRLVARVLTDPRAHPGGVVPRRAGQRAAMAVGLYEVAIDGARVIEPTPEAVCVAISRRRAG